MADDLYALIRVRKHAVEQKQKVVAELYREAEELETQKKTLLEQLAIERHTVDEMGVEALNYFGHYNKAVKERVEDIDEALGKLEVRIQIAQDNMREAYADLKKIEITQERREDEERAEEKKRESDALDEIAIDAYRRKMEETD